MYEWDDAAAGRLSAVLPDWRLADIFSKALWALPVYSDVATHGRQHCDLFNEAYRFLQRAIRVIVELNNEAELIGDPENKRWNLIEATISDVECLIEELTDLVDSRTGLIAPRMGWTLERTGAITPHVMWPDDDPPSLI